MDSFQKMSQTKKKIKLAIASGKGGVGKSMLSSSLALLFSEEMNVVAVDCDVDAPNLDIWLGGVENWDKVIPIVASLKPKIDYKKCDGCGICAEKCRFGAIKMVKGKPVINPFLCEGCGLCELVCPKKAIKMVPAQNGDIKIKKFGKNFNLVSGSLFPGESGSGKVVEQVKEEAGKMEADLMVIDSAPGTGCPVVASLKDADFALLVTEPTLSGFSDLKRVLKVAAYFKIPWSLVINKWDINSKISRRIENWAQKVAETEGREIIIGKISYDKKIFKSVSNLTPIIKTGLLARKEIFEIFLKLRSLIIS